MSIQIDAYHFQPHFLYFSLILIHPPIFVSIFCLSTSIFLFLFVNLDWCLYLSISLSIQIDGYIFQTCFLYLRYSLYIHLYFVSISCLSTFISLYLFVNLYWCLSLHISFSIQIDAITFNPIFFITAQSSSIHLYLFLSLFYPPRSLSISCLSKFTYISFNPLLPISAYLLYIDLYLFLSFCQSKFTAISFNILLFILIYPSSIYLYHFLSLVYFLVIQVHAYIFQFLCLLVVWSSNIVHNESH